MNAKSSTYRRLPSPTNAPDSDESIESYRYKNFLILFTPQTLENTILDLNELTRVSHFGALEESHAIAEALSKLRVRGTKIYNDDFDELDDTEFVELSVEIIRESMDNQTLPSSVEIMDEVADLYDIAKDTFINELLKPPDKKEKK